MSFPLLAHNHKQFQYRSITIISLFFVFISSQFCFSFYFFLFFSIFLKILFFSSSFFFIFLITIFSLHHHQEAIKYCHVSFKKSQSQEIVRSFIVALSVQTRDVVVWLIVLYLHYQHLLPFVLQVFVLTTFVRCTLVLYTIESSILVLHVLVL